MDTTELDRGYASVGADEDGVEIRLLDDDRAIGVTFVQSEVGELIDGKWCDAPSALTLTMSHALAQALLKKLLVLPSAS